ncbi:MAG: hypothetical protein SFX73_00610 [Kofleriaceae bacterium]|nr:hypothetical protein [Kofleriaceae bacterium]
MPGTASATAGRVRGGLTLILVAWIVDAIAGGALRTAEHVLLAEFHAHPESVAHPSSWFPVIDAGQLAIYLAVTVMLCVGIARIAGPRESSLGAGVARAAATLLVVDAVAGTMWPSVAARILSVDAMISAMRVAGIVGVLSRGTALVLLALLLRVGARRIGRDVDTLSSATVGLVVVNSIVRWQMSSLETPLVWVLLEVTCAGVALLFVLITVRLRRALAATPGT